MEERNLNYLVVALGLLLVTLLVIGIVGAADPQGPDDVVVVANETKSNVSSVMVNISGGYVATINLTASVKNVRWKAFVGNITGKFTLDDSGGSTIYDWEMAVTTGRVYATINSTSVTWSGIDCSNNTYLEQENTRMSHNTTYDNITRTFNETDHDSFWVGSSFISADSCPTLSTYVNNASQAQGSDVFEEMVLYDGYNTVYATIVEDAQTGFDGQSYDFQMLVPENGTTGYSGAVAYYLYMELGS